MYGWRRSKLQPLMMIVSAWKPEQERWAQRPPGLGLSKGEAETGHCTVTPSPGTFYSPGATDPFAAGGTSMADAE